MMSDLEPSFLFLFNQRTIHIRPAVFRPIEHVFARNAHDLLVYCLLVMYIVV